MAVEITNLVHAVGNIRGDTTPPDFLAQLGFLAGVTKVSDGVYRVSTEVPIDFGEGICFANTPSPGKATAQIISDSQIEVRCSVDGVPTDLSQVAIAVFRFRTGEVAIPPDPPFPSGSGLPAALAGYGAGVTAIDLYVRTPANGGDDTNAGTAAAPFATLQRAVEEVERTQGAARIHIGSGTFTRPIFRNLYGPVALIGDGGGDAGDDGLNELQGSTAAGAGTGAQLIDGVFAAGAFDGKVVEMLDGAAAGWRRTISDTLVGGLVPLRDYVDQVPAPGDNFRIVEPAIILNGFTIAESWISNCGSVDAQQNDSINAISAVGALNQEQMGIYLVNIFINGGVGAAQPFVRDSNLVLCGVEGDESARLNLNNSMIFVGTDDTANGFFNSLAGFIGVSRDQYAGMGAFFGGAPNLIAYTLARSTFVGYVQQPEELLVGLNGGNATIMGGRLRQLLCQDLSHAFVKIESSPLMNLGEGGAPFGVHAVAGGVIDLQSTGIVILGTTDGIRCQQGSKVYAVGGLSSTGTAGAGMNCSQGGTGYLRGDPTAGTWAGAINGFQVDAVANADASIFNAVDVSLLSITNNLSLVTRVF